MPPTKIMAIRDAETPDGANGVMAEGMPSLEALSATGWRPADALTGLGPVVK